MKMKIYKIIGIVAAVLVVFFSGFLIAGCKTFEPVKIKGELPECNDMYSTMKFYIKSGIKSDSLVTTMATKCNDARIWYHNQQCKRWIFKNGEINKNKFPEYAYYLECVRKVEIRNK
jgi:hypothetical protein